MIGKKNVLTYVKLGNVRLGCSGLFCFEFEFGFKFLDTLVVGLVGRSHGPVSFFQQFGRPVQFALEQFQFEFHAHPRRHHFLQLPLLFLELCRPLLLQLPHLLLPGQLPFLLLPPKPFFQLSLF